MLEAALLTDPGDFELKVFVFRIVMDEVDAVIDIATVSRVWCAIMGYNAHPRRLVHGLPRRELGQLELLKLSFGKLAALADSCAVVALYEE